MSLENLNESEQFFADAMARAGVPMTAAELQAEFENMASAQNIAFKNPGEYSPFWRFIRQAMTTPFLWMIEFMVRYVMPSLFVKTAVGTALDMRGWVYDTTRKTAVKLTGVLTIARSNTSTNVELPMGAWVRTPPINGVVYRVKTTAAVQFSAGSLTAQVPVQAENPGSAYNLAPGYFTILEKAITGITSITNGENWITSPGADEETDDDYRVRIKAKFTTVSDHHVNSVYKSIISEFTGFSYERIFIDHTAAPRGAGSADAYVLFDAGVPGESYLTAVNNYIHDNGYHGHGDDIQVKAMPETLHDISATLWVPAGMDVALKTEIQTEAEQMIRAAFRETLEYADVPRVWPHKRFSFQMLGAKIMARRSELVSLEWGQADIVSTLNVPRLNSLTLTVAEVV